MAEVRRAGSDIARQAGFSETEAGEVAISLTEAATNLLNHASGGQILISSWPQDGTTVLQMLTIDNGPGMNLDACLADGFSTAGTSGTGLGAIRRLAAVFDGYSAAGGTVILAQWIKHRLAKPDPGFSIGVARAPKSGERACGDNWMLRMENDRILLLVVDGLGHGEFAARAADQAVDAAEIARLSSAAEVITTVHQALRGSRGAAVSAMILDKAARSIQYCGLGNVAGALLQASGVQHMVSHNGTAGHTAPKIAQFQYSWPPGSILVVHTDGLQSQWTVDRYPGLLRHHPAIIAGVLARDFSRGRDDLTVLVFKEV